MRTIRLILAISVMYCYGSIDEWNKQKELQRRADMTVTLEDDKQYR